MCNVPRCRNTRYWVKPGRRKLHVSGGGTFGKRAPRDLPLNNLKRLLTTGSDSGSSNRPVLVAEVRTDLLHVLTSWLSKRRQQLAEHPVDELSKQTSVQNAH